MTQARERASHCGQPTKPPPGNFSNVKLKVKTCDPKRKKTETHFTFSTNSNQIKSAMAELEVGR